jgi:hypothetical protein
VIVKKKFFERNEAGKSNLPDLDFFLTVFTVQQLVLGVEIYMENAGLECDR